MIKLKQLMESFTRIEKSDSGLTVADGEAGRGIYFSLDKYPSMISYYKNETIPYRIIRATKKPNTKIIDFTQSVALNKLITFMRTEILGLSKRMGNTYIPPKITQTNYQRFGRLIQDFIRKNSPDADGYIVNHEATGTTVPKGKQLIVLNQDAFDYNEVN